MPSCSFCHAQSQSGEQCSQCTKPPPPYPGPIAFGGSWDDFTRGVDAAYSGHYRPKNELDPSVVAMLREVFDSYDYDRSGTIEKRELRNVLRGLGATPSDREVDYLMSKMCPDGSGKITFKQFRQYCEHWMSS